eukprot:1674690-Prymnesium_polylepis.1
MSGMPFVRIARVVFDSKANMRCGMLAFPVGHSIPTSQGTCDTSCVRSDSTFPKPVILEVIKPLPESSTAVLMAATEFARARNWTVWPAANSACF